MNASIHFVDNTTVHDLPSEAICRLASPLANQHELRVPNAESLHPRCKNVLLKVKNALSLEPQKPPPRGTRQTPAEPEQPRPRPPVQRGPHRSEVVSLADDAGPQPLLPKRGAMMLVNAEAVEEVARRGTTIESGPAGERPAEPAQLAVTKSRRKGFVHKNTPIATLLKRPKALYNACKQRADDLNAALAKLDRQSTQYREQKTQVGLAKARTLPPRSSVLSHWSRSMLAAGRCAT